MPLPPVNLANVNVSLAQFQAVSSGKYNAGEVRLAGENALEQINNHVHSTGKNRVEVSHKEVLAIKEAFVRALSQTGAAADEIRRVRAELGLAAENPRDLSLADRNIRPLTRPPPPPPRPRRGRAKVLDARRGFW